MEAFSLLKFWKSSSACASAANTILAAVSDHEDDEGAGAPPAVGDDGPFFDLEFAGPDSDYDDDEKSLAELVCLEADGGDGGEAEECEPGDILDFRVSSPGSERSDPNLPVSSSDDVFSFRGKLLAVESWSDPNSAKPQLFPVALVRSATRLRILMSGFNRSSRSAQAQPDPKQSQQPQGKKLFAVKFKAGEVPIVSLFTRDHSARPLNGVVSSLSSSSSTSSSSSSSSSSAKQPPSPSPMTKVGDYEHQLTAQAPSTDEKRNSKDGVQKYFKMVKPLYIRISMRYREKLSLGSAASPVVDIPPAVEDKTTENQESGKESEQKMQGSLGVGLRVMMRKRLSGKSKSADAGVVHQADPAAAGGRQRDDSFMQQQEWIQGAILHCKRSFNASRDDESASVLSRSASDPSHEKTVNNCSEEQNDVVGGG